MSKHTLAAVYAAVPDVECKGRCGRNRHQTCCGPIGCTVTEAQRLENYTGIAAPWILDDSGNVIMDATELPLHICPYLGLNGKCIAYEVRPLICRLWAATEGLECPWGCKPKAGLLSKHQSYQLLTKVESCQS